MGQQIEACDGGNVAFDQSGGGAIDNKTSAPNSRVRITFD
jgi:hypothetical protein